MKRHIAIIFGILFITFGIALVLLRSTLLEIPIQPTLNGKLWQIEFVLSAQTEPKDAMLAVTNPTLTNYYRIIDQRYDSQDYSLSFTKFNDRSTVIYSKNNTSTEEHTFSTRYKIAPAEQGPPPLEALTAGKTLTKEERVLVKEVLPEFQRAIKAGGDYKALAKKVLDGKYKPLSKLDSLSKRVVALNLLGLPSRLLYGLQLRDGKKTGKLKSYIYVSDGTTDHIYSTRSKKYIKKETVFLWSEDKEPVQRTRGLRSAEWYIALASLQAELPQASRKNTGVCAQALRWLSLERLSVSTQSNFRILLLLPLASLIVAFLRNVVGIKTFGTFMPAIIALSFRDTGLGIGLLLFLITVIFGVVLRTIFRYFRLLLVPRLASTLTCVVMLLLVLALTGVELKLSTLSNIAIFPVVILSMVIERLSVAIEEHGYVETFQLLFFSLLAAVLSYVVITNYTISYLFSVFPELNLCVLGFAILLGRYFGYRIIELFRFRTFRSA